jgi:hypothetical protein
MDVATGGTPSTGTRGGGDSVVPYTQKETRMRVIEWLPFRADARAVYYLNGEPFHLNAGTVVTPLHEALNRKGYRK